MNDAKLRDQFAHTAMQQFLLTTRPAVPEIAEESEADGLIEQAQGRWLQEIAYRSYQLADTMLTYRDATHPAETTDAPETLPQ